MVLRGQLHRRLRHHEKMLCSDDGVVSSAIGRFVNPPYHLQRLILIGKSISASRRWIEVSQYLLLTHTN